MPSISRVVDYIKRLKTREKGVADDINRLQDYKRVVDDINRLQDYRIVEDDTKRFRSFAEGIKRLQKSGA